MQIHFATTNESKVKSLQRDLSHHGIEIVHNRIELIEPRSSNLKDIAESKINQAYMQIQKPCVVIDSGFYVNSLNGFPKTYVNFALETIGLEGILLLVTGKNRECEFRDCLAYLDIKLYEPEYFLSRVKGKLCVEKRGEMQPHLWSELSQIFIPEGSYKTLAEMSLDDYEQWRKISRDKSSPGNLLYNWLKESGRVI